MEFKEALQRARNIKVELDGKALAVKVVQSKDINARSQALQGVYKFELETKSLSRGVLTICSNAVHKHGGKMSGTVVEQPHNNKYLIPFTLGVAR